MPVAAVACLAAALSIALPAGPVQVLVHLATALGAIVAVMVGTRRNRPPRPATWYLIGSGMASWVAGNAVLAFAGPGATARAVGTLLCAGLYPLVLLGLLNAVLGTRGRSSRSGLLDTTIRTTAVAVVMWVLVAEPAIAGGTGTGPDLAWTLGRALGNLLIFGGLLRLGTTAGGKGTALHAIASVYLVAIIWPAAAAAVTGGPPLPTLVALDPRWLPGFVIVGLVALHPSMRLLTTPQRRAGRIISRPDVASLVLAMLTVPALVAWELAAARRPDVIVVATLATVLTGLVAARMATMARQINRQATRDDLTGLPNRRAMLSAAETRLADTDTRQALLLLDLDRFKEVNDALGHQAGDALLVQVARRLESRLRSGDLLARLGGDEFGVLLRHADRAEAEAVAHDLVVQLLEPFRVDELKIHTDVSVGVALYPDHGEDFSDLLRRADAAVYLAKQDGPVYVHGDPRQDERGDHSSVAEEFRAALDTGQLVLHYQPKVNLTTGITVGVEALVRWQHPTRGLLYPDAFLRQVEEAGLMRALTEEVLSTALDQAATWSVAGRRIAVAVNLPASILVDVDLPAQISVMLAERRLPASALELEITEESLMSDRARARTILSALRDYGVRIAVDDFGTGYSSLAYLRDLPIDELKLDRSFVMPMSDDPRAVALVSSVISLAHSIGLLLVAEGVENGHAYRTLTRVGCDQAQGYYLARPLPADRLEVWLAEREQGAEVPHQVTTS